MTSRDFCFWLQGFFELSNELEDSRSMLNSDQVKLLKEHLALVFKHEIFSKRNSIEVKLPLTETGKEIIDNAKRNLGVGVGNDFIDPFRPIC